jgi:hypothetical protein
MTNDRVKIKKGFIILLKLSERDFEGRGGKEVTDLDGMEGLPAATKDDKEWITDEFSVSEFPTNTMVAIVDQDIIVLDPGLFKESGQSDGRWKAAGGLGAARNDDADLEWRDCDRPAETATIGLGHSTTEPNRTH